MNIHNMEEQLSMLQSIGYTLNIDERLKLKFAHIELLKENPQLNQCKFWGKIEGLSKNYYIMLGLKYTGSYEFPHKYFYWSSEDFLFKELPQLLLQHEGLPEKANNFFTGDPSKVIVTLESEEGQQEENQQNAEGEKKEIDEEQQELKKVPKKNFTELHRLSHVVRAIEHDTQCIPRGSYKMTPEHELSPNHHFYGLKLGNVKDLGNWLHFRCPQDEKSREKIEADNVIFCDDFLESIGNDEPKGVWSIQVDCEERNASCRNLKWPGYYSFHRLESSSFGSVYVGNGIKNIDVAFMI